MRDAINRDVSQVDHLTVCRGFRPFADHRLSSPFADDVVNVTINWTTHAIAMTSLVKNVFHQGVTGWRGLFYHYEVSNRVIRIVIIYKNNRPNTCELFSILCFILYIKYFLCVIFRD